MKKIICLMIFMFIALYAPVRLNAGALPEYVRVGLTGLSGASAVPVGNGRIAVGYGYDMYFTRSAELAGNLTAVTVDFYFVDTGVYFTDYFTAKTAADAYVYAGQNAAAALLDDYSFAVYIGGFTSEADAIDAAGMLPGSAVLPPARRAAIADNSHIALIFDNLYKHGRIAAADGEFIIIGGKTYRGSVELYTDQRGRFCRL